MNKLNNLSFLEKIKKRENRSLKVEEVYTNTELAEKTIEYLKKQTYLEFSKIDILLSNNFDNKSPFGNVLIDKHKEIIGFLGTMFSKRVDSNNNYVLCNLHTWIVNESHRLNSYLLLIPVVDRNSVITTFTPLKTLIGLYHKFGFEKLDMKYRVVLLFHLLGFLKYGRFKIIEDQALVEKYIKKEQLKIYQDHKHLSCLKFIIMDLKDSSNNIFVIALKKRKSFFDVIDLLYVSDNKQFKKYWLSLCLQIGLKFKVFFCGQNFLDDDDCSIPNKILFSKDLIKEICVKNLPSGHKFDTLYSEFVY